METGIQFVKQNRGWNADPNAPEPTTSAENHDVLLRFFLNHWRFKEFKEEEVGILRFRSCSRYRLGPTNDEGWYMGQCRYSGKAPEWGEFYEIAGNDPDRDLPRDWMSVGPTSTNERHFLFYLRDDTFECLAETWEFEQSPRNALLRIARLPNTTGR